MNSKLPNNVHESWKPFFDEYDIDLDSLYNESNTVYPNKNDVFNAFSIPVKDINILFLFQDPYHDGSACGYAVASKIKIPPSLRNIYTELKNEFPERDYTFENGDLEKWVSREKIFLLNCALTVVKGCPLSHIDYWTDFTDDVIRYVDSNNPKCVYLLLGNHAKNKCCLIKNKENIITGVHPSPLSAHRGFFNSGVFKQVEDKLGKKIDWSI